MRRLVPIACNQLFTVAIGVVSYKIISRLVPPEVFGPYALLLTLTQLCMGFTHPGLFNCLIRSWQRERSRAGSYARFLWREHWRAVRWLPLVVAAALLVAFSTHTSVNFLWAFAVLLVVNIATAQAALAQGALNAQEKQWSVFGLNAANTASRMLLPAGAALLAGASVPALLGGLALHALVLFAVVLLLFRWVSGAPAPDAETAARWRKELKDYGRPFLLLGAAGWLATVADRWIVALFFGEERLGLFSLAANLGTLIPAMASAGLLQLLFPKIFRRADEAKSHHDWRELARQCDRQMLVFLAVTLVGLAALHWAGPHLIGWFIDAKYTRAIPLLLPSGLAAAGGLILLFPNLILQGQQNSAAMVRVMLVMTGVKTALSAAAAAVSWEWFLGWLVLSLPVSALLGRVLIRREALKSSS